MKTSNFLSLNLKNRNFTKENTLINIYRYTSWKARNMNQEEAASNLELDLKLNISPSLDSSSLPSTESSSSSLCSEEAEGERGEAKSMVVVGCPNCIMYIIMSLESNPRCPRCNSHVLLDFLTGNHSNKKH
ncbi:Protein salt-induced and EIN3/EIL1-dependent 1 [Cardamine amara subsp. amara]|uniref:Protein salt-induced and EIN3/EIL1-dependent 1 n=1 Tax=Cardamine amara subsp. amara TaxID=228776 RepID=A0ABD0ZX51_CARAN